jgi:hypothetical protein
VLGFRVKLCSYVVQAILLQDKAGVVVGAQETSKRRDGVQLGA